MCMNYTSSSALQHHTCWVFRWGVPPSSDHGGKRLGDQGFTNLTVYTNRLGLLGSCRFAFSSSEVGLQILLFFF